ncbi:unnamed protein product [Orchesella dallaii]|uniref:Cyclopropane-fatty-acyl-phospholipid synthase n=1 Tax=Orchesella dallaii TaxID=48710 RepID=A0ABP1QEM3_9HEXA
MANNGSLFYILTIKFIRAYKSFEAVIIRLFLGFFENLVRKSYLDAGIELDGSNPWDITVHNKNEFFLRLTNHAPLGLGETYVEGVWDCDDLVELNYRTMRKAIYKAYMNPWNRFLNYMELMHFNMQTEKKAWEVGEKHYNLGNDLFESFLDPSMNYSCGYWKTAKSLAEAQTDKMDLIAKKLMLSPGMSVLDIGCGWGGLSKYLAENYGVRVVGITVSQEGAKYARERCSKLPVDIRLMDYRDLDEKFDRIVSVGKHVRARWTKELWKFL